MNDKDNEDKHIIWFMVHSCLGGYFSFMSGWHTNNLTGLSDPMTPIAVLFFIIGFMNFVGAMMRYTKIND